MVCGEEEGFDETDLAESCSISGSSDRQADDPMRKTNAHPRPRIARTKIPLVREASVDVTLRRARIPVTQCDGHNRRPRQGLELAVQQGGLQFLTG